MKLTKAKLKQIIKEELTKILYEYERKDVEIGDIVKHKKHGQGTVRSIRQGKGAARGVVVSWADKKVKPGLEPSIGALTVVKKSKKR
jgi:hypothetical protein